MITITTENEKEIFDAGYPCIVPFLMTETDGNVEFEIYEGITDLVNDFISRFEGEYFCDRALTWLDGKIRPYLEKNGFYREKYGILRWYHQFTLAPGDAVNTALILPETVKISEKIPSKTLMKASEMLDGGSEVFGVIEYGAVVSLAAVNENESGGCSEITVETSPSCRKRGFGASNTAALAESLLESGETVAYCCSRYNRGSIRIARRVGFRETGRFYAIDAYPIENRP